MLKNKPFTVTYYSAKDKKTITRNALWTDQCRYWTSKAGRLIMTYFDVDKNEYRNATDTWVLDELGNSICKCSHNYLWLHNFNYTRSNINE